MINKEKMNPKKYLSQIEKYNNLIAQKKTEKEAVKSDAEGLTGSEYIEQMANLERQIGEEIVELANSRHRIIGEIQSLAKRKHVEILHERYVRLKSLMEIAVEKNYTYDYVKKLHGYALVEFDNKVLKKLNK